MSSLKINIRKALFSDSLLWSLCVCVWAYTKFCVYKILCCRSLASEPALFASPSSTARVCVLYTAECTCSMHRPIQLSTSVFSLFLSIITVAINYSAHLSGNINIWSFYSPPFSFTHPLSPCLFSIHPLLSVFSFVDQLFLNTWTHPVYPPPSHDPSFTSTL